MFDAKLWRYWAFALILQKKKKKKKKKKKQYVPIIKLFRHMSLF